MTGVGTNLVVVMAEGALKTISTKNTDMAVDSKFWWVQADWVNFKAPMKHGRVILPHDYLEPGYQIDTSKFELSFPKSKSDKGLIGDFAHWSRGTLFVNQTGYGVFERLFVQHGRTFPVKCSGLQYYIFLCDLVLPGFDLQRSIYTHFGKEENIEEDIDQIKHIALRPEFYTDAGIFRLDGSLIMRDHLIVSERFRDQYETANLSGLLFKSTDPEDWKNVR